MMKIKKTLSVVLAAGILALQPILVAAEEITSESSVVNETKVINEPVLLEETSAGKWIGTVTLTSGKLNVRKGPSTNDDIIGKLPNGTKVEVLEQLEEWVIIPFKESTAYVSKPYMVILQEKANANTANKKIVVLDPGHGGKDPGAIAKDGTYESVLVWQYTVKAKERLEKLGYIVHLTRGEKNSCTPYKIVEEELACRVAFAEKVKGDIFISIHADSNHDKKFRGTVTFYNAKNDWDGNQNRFPAESKSLAQSIHSKVQPVIGSKDRGVQNKNYFVNRMNTVPSVLIELGCLTNSADLKLLKDKKKQDKFAASLGKAVEHYFETSGL